MTTLPLKPTRRPRWLRFGLRGMLLAMTAVCLWLGLHVNRPRITPQNVMDLRLVSVRPWDVSQVAWSSSGTRAALVRWERPVEIYELKTLTRLSTVGAGRKLIDFAFSPDNRHVGYCENDNDAWILDTRTGVEARLPTGNPQPDTAFSPDGRRVVTGGYGTSAQVWSVPKGVRLQTLVTGDVVGGLTPLFSPDGRWIAVGNRNSSTCIFNAATGELAQRLAKPNTQELAFSPDSKRLAVTYVDGSLSLYQVADGAELSHAERIAEELYAVDWSPDGKLLATSGSGGAICLWNGQDLTLLRELPAPTWVITVRFSPDGARLITAGGDNGGNGPRHLRIFAIGRFYEGWWDKR